MTGMRRQADAAAISVRPFQDPDRFHELVFANPIAARCAIADEVGVPLAKLSDEDRTFIDALLASMPCSPELWRAPKSSLTCVSAFPQGRRGGVG